MIQGCNIPPIILRREKIIMKPNFLSLFLLAAASTNALYAASLSGIVKDAHSHEELIGAHIYVKENPQIGTTTGLDGSFVLNNIPEHQPVTLVCTYVGYENREQIIKEPAPEKLLIDVFPSDNELGEVTILASADRSSDASARLSEKQSPLVSNIVSARSIEISPDLNVSNILARVSGVTLERNGSGDGQYAVLRGMDKRYNYTLVNGVKISSPDNKNRYVPLDIFPGELLDRLEVSKSLTADMEGDATGGVVNMVMKNAPDKWVVQAYLSAGYGTELMRHSFSTYNRSGITWKAPRTMYGSDYNASVSDFGRGTAQLSSQTALPNMVAGPTVGNRFIDKRLGVLLAVSFQNYYHGKESLFFTDDVTQSTNEAHLTDMKDRFYSEHRMQYGAHLKVDWRFSPDHVIEWYNALIGSDRQQVRESTITDLSLNYAPAEGNVLQQLETRSRLTRQLIFASTLKGTHHLSTLFSADWTLAGGYASNNRPDNTYITLENNRQNYVDYITADNSERRWEQNNDRDWAAYVNLKYKQTLGDNTLSAKVGGMYRDKARRSDYVSYRFVPAATSRPVQGVDFNTLDEIEWRIVAPQGGVGPLTYDAGERIGAAYIMATYGNASWEAVAGVRAEHTDQFYHMYFPPAGSEPDGGQQYWDILPSVAVKYMPRSDMNLRASYYRSINRPGFFEIVPYSIIEEEYTEYGNPDLKRAVIDNVDLRWEWFMGTANQLMAGVFYKYIQNPIEYAYYSVNNRQFGYGFTNLGNATNVGFELDFIYYFRYFGVKANYTYTYSQIESPKTLYGRDESGKLVRNTVMQRRPLVEQAPHVANLSLLYKNTRYGWDVQLAANYTGERMVVVSHYYNNDHWMAGSFGLDLSIEKKFAHGISLFFKGKNLLNTPSRIYIKNLSSYNDNFPHQDASKGYTLIEEEREGASFLLGVRYKL